MQLREALPELTAAGAEVVAVSAKSAFMARTLQADIPFPLLLDPDHTLRTRLRIGRLSAIRTIGLRSTWNYMRALGGIKRWGIQLSEATQTPAVVIFAADQSIAWTHVGAAVGDYPAVSDIVDRIPRA